MPHRLHLEQFGPVHALPVLHYRMEFAWLVREAVHRVKPDCIALELPPTLEAPFLRGVARLPEVSVLRYGTRAKKGEETVYLLVEPADPLVEGARLGRELGIPVALVDVDTDSYPLHHEPLPDPYAIHRIGLTPYYEEYGKGAAALPHGPEDRRREQGMAFRLRELAREHGRILFICGMFHLERVKEEFGRPQAAPLERVRRENVALFNLHPDSCREILGEFPFLSAVYELRRGPLPPELVDGAATLRKRFSALELIAGGKREIPEEELLRHAVERSARHAGREGEFPDRQRIIFHLFREAARHYRQETGEQVHLWQKRAFFRFARNYALTGGMLLPDLFQLLAAARGCIDDNFAYAFWRLATHYPWQRTDADLPTIAISPEEIWGGARRIRFRPRQKRQKGLSHLGFLKRKKEKRPGEWLEGFDNPSICSYPPEDVVIEDYGRFLKRKGAMQLSEELSRTEPFTASLLDGIDMRETLRNLTDGRIYVRENQRAKGGVGGVVVIFDEDRDNRRFPYRMTWLGEHDQESDMAFYATSPADNIVGPGICRCEYGGFLLSYPPRRMMDVWHDPDYAFARTKAEVLLLAALDYSPEKHVVYAAPRPPRSMFRQLAARMGKKIVYIPLGSLSPVKLKGLRVLHILHGHDKREIAKDYVW
ncbi:hypothetical protein KI811_09335 [Geobacter hydrogenophilus]|uniref:Uncharacterized protein n=1 Tax=Geobacter hydrogenophilus TaxID=40983 RepID=A0A9W6LD28_9BACT|nr:hypothetical protein [Geobacter hydrogenophilus]MBT0894012.1 hypothetical protein [Geobacter hydrogenophilus]GLI38041.1 hypothetical protein GHYDROH2_15420 [Geobacter hydrogenophilus]